MVKCKLFFIALWIEKRTFTLKIDKYMFPFERVKRRNIEIAKLILEK